MLSVLPALGISRRGELSKEERKKKKDRSKEKAKSKEMTRKESDRTRKKAQVRVTQAPKSIRVTTREVDEENVKHLVAKFKLERQNHSRLVLKPDLDDKAKILMDRVNKKPYPIKYVTQGRQTNESLLADEASSFFRPSAPRKVSSAGSILQEDCYDYTPNLDEVLILPDENVYRISRRGAEVPYWAEKTEPDEEDTVCANKWKIIITYPFCTYFFQSPTLIITYHVH
uniref:Uncharacterized protein n=1 Tax=Caenorhabditis japonica TaxID=281687 RepID=H2WKM2_CAEJA